MFAVRCHWTLLAPLCGLGLLASTACIREAEPEICPGVAPGDLVISEIRGAQDGGNDTYGQWFELFNRSGGPLDLRGVQLRLFRRDGSGEEFLIVRAPELVVNAGAYVVLGHHDPMRLPEFVDYSFFSDYFGTSSLGDPQTRDIYSAGVLEVLACGEPIDRLVYSELPAEGSWSLDGTREPNADENDDINAWCKDAEDPPPDGPQLYIGIPGTPGEANRPCM